MSTFTRVFLSFAPQDANHRSLLIGATKAARLPVRFFEMPNNVTDVRSRRALCLSKLQQCDVAVVMLSEHALDSLALESDIAAVRTSGLPLHAIMAGIDSASTRVPDEWRVSSVTRWHWPQVAARLQRLHDAPERTLAAV